VAAGRRYPIQRTITGIVLDTRYFAAQIATLFTVVRYLPSLTRMGGDIKTYRDLEAWQLGMRLVEEVYLLTRLMPREELFGLTSQLRRAAMSIPSNVAEGQQIGSNKLYARHVSIALGSEGEVQTQLELIVRLKLLRADRVQPVMQLAARTGQLLRGLKRSVTRRIQQSGAQRP
jgi:four helix bundle protein